MKNNSFISIADELTDAQDQLAKTLNIDSLVLESFNESEVLYKKADGSFVKADFLLDSENISFTNLQEMVVDETSESEKRKELVAKILDAIYTDKEPEANIYFEKIVEMNCDRLKKTGTLLDTEELQEAYARQYGTRGKGGPKVEFRAGAKDPKKAEAARKGHRKHASSYAKGAAKRKSNLSKERVRRRALKSNHSKLSVLSGGKQYSGRRKRKFHEWQNLGRNVFEYVDFVENGYLLKQSAIKLDESGNPVAVRIPSSEVRKKLFFEAMKKKKKAKMGSASSMRADALGYKGLPVFAKSVAEVKKLNNLHDIKGLQEALESFAVNFPNVIMLSDKELAESIAFSLDSIGVSNYDDDICKFLAEGILRTAFENNPHKVEKVYESSEIKMEQSEDAYLDFQSMLSVYLPVLDEGVVAQKKVFEDLARAAYSVRELAIEEKNDFVVEEAEEYYDELLAIIENKTSADFDLAYEVSEWLQSLAEANLPMAGKWEVETPIESLTGDIKSLTAKSKISGAPADFDGDWDDEVPQVDGDKKNVVKSGSIKGREHGFANEEDKDTFPKLSNPSQSNAGEFKIKGEKEVTEKDGFENPTQNTFPKLDNPYLPKSMIFKSM